MKTRSPFTKKQYEDTVTVYREIAQWKSGDSPVVRAPDS